MPVCEEPEIVIRLSELLEQWTIGESTESEALKIIELLKEAFQTSKVALRYCFIVLVMYRPKQKDMFVRFADLLDREVELIEKMKGYCKFHIQRSDGTINESWVHED